MSDDAQFEQNFADLAYAHLRGKAQRLLDYLLGFQVVDKNEEGTKAAGVFGFQVGEQSMMAPMFFINGALKGHQLLRLVESDSFVPLRENWVNYLIGRKPSVLGEATPFTDRQLRTYEPDLSIFSESPLSSKYSCVQAGRGYWFDGTKEFDIQPFLRDFCIRPSHPVFKQASERCSLDAVFAKYGSRIARPLAELMAKYPQVGDAVARFYDVPSLLEKASAADINIAFSGGADASDEGAVRVITADTPEDLSNFDFTPAEQQRILAEGEVYRDSRKNTTLVYRTRENKILSKPAGAGVYSVLTRGAKTAKGLFFPVTTTIGDGHSSVGVLADPDGKGWALVDPRGVLARVDKLEQEWSDFFAKLPSASAQVGKTYMAVGPTGGAASVPFEVLKRETDGDATRLYVYVPTWPVVKTRDSKLNSCYDGPVVRHTAEGIDLVGRDLGCCGPTTSNDQTYKRRDARIVCIQPGSRSFSKLNDTLLVPDGFKLLELGEQGGLDFRPGTELDMTSYLYKQAGLKDLYVEFSGRTFQVEAGGRNSGSLTRKEAMRRLVLDCAVGVDDAYNMLDSAVTEKRAHFLVKPAFSVSPGDIDSMRRTTGFLGNPGDLPVSRHLVIPELRGGSAQPMGQDDIANVLQQAAATGQKEVFDTASLAALVSTTRVGDSVDELLSDIVLGLDRIGRVLFMFYWHNDKFIERYGEDDMKELEDALVNSFTGVGDLALFLKKAVIEPDVATMGSDVELDKV